MAARPKPNPLKHIVPIRLIKTDFQALTEKAQQLELPVTVAARLAIHQFLSETIAHEKTASPASHG